MVVVVTVVGRVPMAVVDVVDVVAVRYRDMAAARAVRVLVRGALDVRRGLALVEVAVVFAMQVPVVDVVHVVAVRNRDMPTAGAVDVGVFRMLYVCRCHRLSLVLVPVDCRWSTLDINSCA
ncbi:hypothetical protein NCAST_31_01890 [Nocardia asteroides NBRC 15531]|uniref:Uncharacterized protein n=1 Tax=Nocardia asteroides NBRC 15531 TaxID=1110697 RepID=U5EGH1_NOCAS|nr:hypothetical protein NCAST_31_01890 [Nocardia asteroides NBRC 15531]